MKTHTMMLETIRRARLGKPVAPLFFFDRRYIAVVVALCRDLDSK